MHVPTSTTFIFFYFLFLVPIICVTYAITLHYITLQVQCLSIDSRGELLLTGDESGVICLRLLHSRHSSSQGHQGVQGTACRSQELGAEGETGSGAGGGGGGVAKVLKGAHEGGVLAISHVEGSLRLAEDGTASSSALFVSGGKGEGQNQAPGGGEKRRG